MTIRSGVSTLRRNASRLPNQTAISATACRATMNWRLARKKSLAGYNVCNVSSGLSSGYFSPSSVQAVTRSSLV